MAARDDLRQALKRLDRAKQEHGAASVRLSRHLAGVEAGSARLRAAMVEFYDALGVVAVYAAGWIIGTVTLAITLGVALRLFIWLGGL